MTLIVLLPVIIFEPYQVLMGDMNYTEDGIAFNEAYQALFSESGNAGAGDFFMYGRFDTISGKLLVVTVGVFIVGDEPTILDTEKNPGVTYFYSVKTAGSVRYGVAVFGHKLSDIVNVEISVSVVG